MTAELLTRVMTMPDSLEVRETAGTHFIRGVAAPYNEPADIGDYIEELAPGVFRRSIDHRGPNIGLMEQHNRDTFAVGINPSFEETGDGLVATFEVSPTNRGQEALQLAKTGHFGMSVGFIPVRNDVTEVDGRRLVRRLEAKLDHVGLVLNPAYKAARILEARDDDPAPFDPDNPAVAPRLARLRALHGLRRLQ